MKITRPSLKDDAELPRAHVARVTVRWFIKFRGRKGATDINVGAPLIVNPWNNPVTHQGAMDVVPAGDENLPSLFNP